MSVNCLPFQSRSIILVDAAGEQMGYASDITRTFPVNGVYSDTQKEIYNMVLEVQVIWGSLVR